MAHTEQNDVVEDLVGGGDPWGRCSYGEIDHPAEKFMSGTPICWAHWRWIKLDLPAAECWADKAESFIRMVDMHDLMHYFPDAGMSDAEVQIMMTGLRKIANHSHNIKEGPK